MRITFDLAENRNHAEWVSDTFINLCDDDLQRLVDLPAKCTRFEAVFTRKPKPDSFEIRQSYKGRRHVEWCDLWTPEDGHIVMTRSALNALRSQFKAGYRYVHVEYQP